MTVLQRSKSLDYLRIFASLWVLIYHLADPDIVPALFSTTFTKYFFSNGWYGVEIFFLLSAFLIGSQMRHTTFKRFVERRVIRLFPGLAVGLGVSILIAKLGGVPEHSTSFPRPILSYFSSIALAYEYFEVKPASNTLWSLIIEVRYYALIAGLLLISKFFPIRFKTRLLLLLVYLVFLLVDQQIANIRGLIHLDLSLDRLVNNNGFLPIFALGTVTGSCHLTIRSGWTVMTGLITSMCWILIFLYHGSSYTLVSILFLSWTLLLQSRSPSTKAESSKIIKVLSESTFITYLIHLELGELILFNLDRLDMLGPYVQLFSTIAVVVFVSVTLSQLFELPFRSKLYSFLE